ncbi:MAG: carbon monoxide dehydrogenase subunit G [Burkholderiales bacterium]|nr:carbon monoxide dehydrogenase subunit G [Burkholderiales bacterium]
MELNGDILIGAPRERVWLALNDPQVLLASIPGGEEVRQLSPTETHVRVLIKMGPVRARFVGKILMSEVRPGEGCTLNFEGSGGAAGFASGRSTVALTDEGAGTRLRYTAAASVGGKLGQIGGRMIDASAKQTADQFFEAFGAQLGATPPAVAPESSEIPSFAPRVAVAASASTAAGVAGASEQVRVLWFALGAGATAFGFWVARALGH